MSNTNSTGKSPQLPGVLNSFHSGARTSNSDEPIVTQEQIKHLSDEGYLVRERLVQGELLTRLRDAVDELTVQEKSHHSVEKYGIGGLFIRNLLDRHETFHELLNYAPTLSLAREILGYRLQVHALFLRVTYPEHKNQEVAWHFHQRLNRELNSKQRFQPIVLDNLIYLDDVTVENGPLCVLPKSHLWQEPPPNKDFSDKEGQVILTLPAGSCVSLQGSTLHRALRK